MAYQIYIELNTRRLILKNNGSIIATYPVAIGKPSTPTPVGDFKVLNKNKKTRVGSWEQDGSSLPGSNMVSTGPINPG